MSIRTPLLVSRIDRCASLALNIVFTPVPKRDE
jgi:hypothetical protein